jgi:hypothetical protein
VPLAFVNDATDPANMILGIRLDENGWVHRPRGNVPLSPNAEAQ